MAAQFTFPTCLTGWRKKQVCGSNERTNHWLMEHPLCCNGSDARTETFGQLIYAWGLLFSSILTGIIKSLMKC